MTSPRIWRLILKTGCSGACRACGWRPKSSAIRYWLWPAIWIARLGGPCVYPYIDPRLFQSSTKRTWPGKPDDDPSTWRRSLYVYSKRSIRYPLFRDVRPAESDQLLRARNRSTIAPQALLLMNNNFVITGGQIFRRTFAARSRRRSAGSGGARLIGWHWDVLPVAFERAKAVEFIQSSPNGLTEFCQALFNLNEFVYRQ